MKQRVACGIQRRSKRKRRGSPRARPGAHPACCRIELDPPRFRHASGPQTLLLAARPMADRFPSHRNPPPDTKHNRGGIGARRIRAHRQPPEPRRLSGPMVRTSGRRIRRGPARGLPADTRWPGRARPRRVRMRRGPARSGASFHVGSAEPMSQTGITATISRVTGSRITSSSRTRMYLKPRYSGTIAMRSGGSS